MDRARAFWRSLIHHNPSAPGEIKALQETLGYKDVDPEWFEGVLSTVRYTLENSIGALAFLDGVTGTIASPIREPVWFEQLRSSYTFKKHSIRKMPDGTWQLHIYAWLDDNWREGYVEYEVVDVEVYEDELITWLASMGHVGFEDDIPSKDALNALASNLYMYPMDPLGANAEFNLSIELGPGNHDRILWVERRVGGGSRTKRVRNERIRIGKMLQQVIREKEKELKRGEKLLIVKENITRLRHKVKRAKEYLHEFETRAVPYRWRISADPVDVATMTQGRPWLTCAKPYGAGELTPLYDVLAGSAILFYYRGSQKPVGRTMLRPVARSFTREFGGDGEKYIPAIVTPGVVKGSGELVPDEELSEAIYKQTGFRLKVITGQLSDYIAITNQIMDDYTRTCGHQTPEQIQQALDILLDVFSPMIVAAWRAGKLQTILPPESARELARDASRERHEELKRKIHKKREDPSKQKSRKIAANHKWVRERWKLINQARVVINQLQQLRQFDPDIKEVADVIGIEAPKPAGPRKGPRKYRTKTTRRTAERRVDEMLSRVIKLMKKDKVDPMVVTNSYNEQKLRENLYYQLLREPDDVMRRWWEHWRGHVGWGWIGYSK